MKILNSFQEIHLRLGNEGTSYAKKGRNFNRHIMTNDLSNLENRSLYTWFLTSWPTNDN